VENAPVVLFAIDRAGTFTSCDGRGREVLGIPWRDMVGRSAFEVYARLGILDEARGRMSGEDALRRALAGHYVSGVGEMNGATFEFRLIPMFGHEGELLDVIGVATDTTERTRAEHALRDERKRARDARNVTEERLLRADRLSALGTLATGVAHEINNPMTYVLGNVEYVARRLRAGLASTDPLQQDELRRLLEALTHAVEGIHRVRSIVRDLMTFSSGNITERSLVDVRAILQSSIQMAWHEIRHRARLVKALGDVPPVDANEARLGQVFLNLLVNAAQAIPEGAADRHEVRVSTYTNERGQAVVEITDTGVGIPEAILPRIFDPFFTTKRMGEGTGLGLSISHGLVKDMGGEISVRSNVGKGTTFTITLPSARGFRTPLPSRASLPAIVERTRVLIIDDDPMVGEAIALTLRDEHDVEVVTAARDALKRMAGGERYDTILCDLMMPVMTGMDLYTELLRVAPDAVASIVFITGGALTPRMRAFLDGIGGRCVEKPLAARQLRELVRSRARTAR
jgi:signal transduction histidine kinase